MTFNAPLSALAIVNAYTEQAQYESVRHHTLSKHEVDELIGDITASNAVIADEVIEDNLSGLHARRAQY